MGQPHLPSPSSLRPRTTRATKLVLVTFIDGTGVDGVGWSKRASAAYVVVIETPLAQYTLTGRRAYSTSHKVRQFSHQSFRIRCQRAYDRGNHNVAISGPIIIIVAINVSVVLGWFFILGLLFLDSRSRDDGHITGQPVRGSFWIRSAKGCDCLDNE